jgi:hypothetical protein
MTPTISPSRSSLQSRSSSSKHVDRRSASAKRAARARRRRYRGGYEHLGRYADRKGHAREVVGLPGALGSVLVVDRDSSTLGDVRLLAHLASDEPPRNARLVCDSYLADSRGRWSRPVTPEDLETVPFAREQLLDARAGAPPSEVELTDCHGRRYRLQVIPGERCSLQVRWCRSSSDSHGDRLQAVSVRDVIACLESYQPVRSLTLEALAFYRGEPQVSVAMLGLELERVDRSPLVLNRLLRETALATIERQGLSVSEVAKRCGRVKRDPRGRVSGETSWLARRLGIVPSAGESEPTPWVHTDVLALIAREGLRISPREVELS